MKVCEYCGKEHDGSFASGRFCCRSCSYGFSTKNKRKEINEKVSKSLKKEPVMVEKVCPNCSKTYKVHYKRVNQKCCSKECSSKLRAKDPAYIENLSKKRIERIINGQVNNFGTKLIYNFNGNDIKCDSKIEYACLNYFEILGAKSIERCKFSIEYKDGDKIRRYNPDFLIKTIDKTYIAEAKGDMYILFVNEKWRMYNELSVLKKIALDEYCKTNNFLSFWFTKNLHYKYYRNIVKPA